MRWLVSILLLFCLFLSVSCFFGPNTGPRVLGFRHGRVYLTRDASYQVGELPAGWSRFKTGARAIAFHHNATGATISTDAFCGAAFEDLTLPALMGHLFTGFLAERIIRTTPLWLNGREALRQVSRRNIDGVVLQFDAVVLKKNQCTFDFVCLVPPTAYADVAPMFEAFYSAFAYD